MNVIVDFVRNKDIKALSQARFSISSFQTVSVLHRKPSFIV